MSLFVPKFDESVVVREAEAEVVGRAPTTVRLLADSSSTGGALSTQRVTLTAGADGAKPHWHDNSAEMFFLLDGAADILSGDEVLTAGPGDPRACRLDHVGVAGRGTHICGVVVG